MGCSENINGTRTFGVKGSPAWWQHAPLADQVNYVAPSCRAYGFVEGTSQFSACVQNEISDRKARAQLGMAISQARRPANCMSVNYGSIIDTTCY